MLEILCLKISKLKAAVADKLRNECADRVSQEYQMGAEAQCNSAIYGIVQHDKPDINSPLLKAARPRWCSMLVERGVVTAEILRCPSFDHLYL